MKACFAVRLFCLLAVLVLVIACGCSSTYNTPRRQRMRAHTVETDLDHAVDDWDWMLGRDKPQPLYDDEMW